MPRVLIADQLSPAAEAIFRERGLEVDTRVGMKPAELIAVIGDYDGLAIRSATKVTAEPCSRPPPGSRSSAGPASASTISTSRPRPSAAWW